MRRIHASVLLLCLAAAPFGAGCEALRQDMGFDGEYMLVGRDAMVRPGEDAAIEVRLRKGNFFLDQANKGVYFFRDGNFLAVVKTDHEGEVHLPFRPPGVGDYRFLVECYPSRKQPGAALAVQVVVACREANTPLCVVDIDNTLSDPNGTGVRQVVEDSPPMPGAPAAMARLAQTCAVVYLTHRPDYLCKITREWLDKNHLPPGIILAARRGQILEGNEKLKARILAEFRRQFGGPGVGIGDRASDTQAYASAGLRPFLIVPDHTLTDARAVRAALEQVAELPPSAEVVRSWAEFEQAVLGGATFPASAARLRLETMLKDMEK